MLQQNIQKNIISNLLKKESYKRIAVILEMLAFICMGILILYHNTSLKSEYWSTIICCGFALLNVSTIRSPLLSFSISLAFLNYWLFIGHHGDCFHHISNIGCSVSVIVAIIAVCWIIPKRKSKMLLALNAFQYTLIGVTLLLLDWIPREVALRRHLYGDFLGISEQDLLYVSSSILLGFCLLAIFIFLLYLYDILRWLISIYRIDRIIWHVYLSVSRRCACTVF